MFRQIGNTFFFFFSFFQRFHYFFLIRFCTKSLALKKHKQYIHESKSIILSSIYRHRFSHTQVGVRLVGVGVAAQSRGAYRPTVLFWPCLAHYWLLPFPPMESLVPPLPLWHHPPPPTLTFCHCLCLLSAILYLGYECEVFLFRFWEIWFVMYWLLRVK